MRGDRGAGEPHRFGVALGVVGMPMRIDDVRHRQPLGRGPVSQHAGRVRGVDQDAALRVPITDEVPEVPVAAGTHLFEYQLHDGTFFSSGLRRYAPVRISTSLHIL